MKSFLVFLVLLLTNSAWAQSMTFRYEGEIAGPGISGNTLGSQSFRATIRRSDGCGGNLIAYWTISTITIDNGAFAISPVFPAATISQIMHPLYLDGTCSVPYPNRDLVVEWYSGSVWETFYIGMADSPRATLADETMRIGGVDVLANMTCASGNYLFYDSALSKFKCQAIAAAQVPSLAGDVTGNISSTTVTKIQSVAVNSAAPSTGQVLKYNGTEWSPAADDSGGAPADATYSTKGVVQIDTGLGTSGLNLTAGVLSLPNVISAAGPIGSASAIPILTYDAKGRLTTVTTTTVNDSTKLPLAGGTMTGSINMGTQNITNATSVAATNFSGRNFYFADADTNNIHVKSPTNITADYALTLPIDDGSSGQVLSTDGNGVLAWISGSSGTVSSVSSANSYISITTPTTTPVFTANVGTVANTLAAGDDARITGALQISDYAADVFPAQSCTTAQTPYWSSGLGTWLCQNIDVALAGGFVAGGNVVGSPAVLGTNSNHSLQFETNALTRMTLQNTGNVGIGTTSPSTLLAVAGDVTIGNAGMTSTTTLGVQGGSTSTFRFPTSNGAAGQVLHTSGSGNTHWDYDGGGIDFTLQTQVLAGAESIVGIGASPSFGGTHSAGYSNSGKPSYEVYSLTTNFVIGVSTTSQIHSSWNVVADFNWYDDASLPTSNVRRYMGFSNNLASFSTTPTPPFANDVYTGTSALGFRFSSAAGDSSYMCLACNAGTCSNNATGVVPTSGGSYKMRIERNGGTAKFFINGNAVCTISTNLPSSVYLYPMITSQTLDGSGKHLRFHRMRVRAND